MSPVNPENERLKRRYQIYQREARGYAPNTIDLSARAIAEFENFSGGRSFKTFCKDDAVGFKKRLLDRGGRKSIRSARATVLTKLSQLQNFFRWLAEQPGYRSRIDHQDIEYFSLSRAEERLVREQTLKPAPSLEQAQSAIRAMPVTSDLEKRNRAVMALLLLTGARVSAIISLKVKHVRRDRLGIDQDATEVKTKFRKTSSTFFMPVGKDIEAVFLDYVDYLRTELLFGDNDPLFPRTSQKGLTFESRGLSRTHWKTADPVRDIVKAAFEGVQVSYYSPHTFRSTLVQLGSQLCTTPEQFKAWSQNISHEGVMTTFRSYGRVDAKRQAELIREMGEEPAADTLQDLLAKTLARLERDNPG